MADHQPPSRFAFILHADVVDSTALVQKDERVAHQMFQDAFRNLSLKIKHFGGLTHEIRGDALVAEFEKASDTVSAALAFQHENEAASSGAAGEGVRLRIGIAMGEVIVADRTVTGAGVVLAQRLEQLAKAGEVVIQGAACESIPQRMPFRFESLGEHEVNGFERPVRAFKASATEESVALEQQPRSTSHRFTGGRRNTAIAVIGALVIAVAGVSLAAWQPWRSPSATPTTLPLALPLPEIPSLAVLPLSVKNGGSDQVYLADGLIDHVISSLSRVHGLFVIARGSTFAYKGSSISAPRIAAELGVAYIAQGTLERLPDTLELEFTLIDAATEKVLAKETLEKSPSQILELHDELAVRIVSALGVKLSDEQRAQLLRRDTNDPIAYDFFLRGQASLFRLAERDNALAREMYLRATDRDPLFARAWASLAMTHLNDIRFRWNNPGEASLAQAREAAAKALSADSRLPRAHLASGYVALLANDSESAIRYAEQAVTLDPGLADGHVLLADAHTLGGDANRAVEDMRRAMRINPYPPSFYEMSMGRALYFAGQTETAREHLQRAVELNPNVVSSRVLLAATYGELDEVEEAEREAEQILTLDPEFTTESWLSRSSVRASRYVESIKENLKSIGLPSGGSPEAAPRPPPVQSPDTESGRR